LADPRKECRDADPEGKTRPQSNAKRKPFEGRNGKDSVNVEKRKKKKKVRAPVDQKRGEEKANDNLRRSVRFREETNLVRGKSQRKGPRSIAQSRKK